MEFDPSPDERRRSPRISRHQHIRIRKAEDDGETTDAQVMNISDGGVKFVSSLQIEAGGNVELHIGNARYSAVILDCKTLFEGYSMRAEFLSE